MCLELTKSEFTQKSIRVFKVFFIRDEKITLPFKDKDQTVFDVCSNRSHGFFDGFGYHSFLSKKNATTYAHIIRTYQPVWIIGMLIPKNSYYSVGKIESGFKGSGIEAVRSEIKI